MPMGEAASDVTPAIVQRVSQCVCEWPSPGQQSAKMEGVERRGGALWMMLYEGDDRSLMLGGVASSQISTPATLLCSYLSSLRGTRRLSLRGALRPILLALVLFALVLYECINLGVCGSVLH